MKSQSKKTAVIISYVATIINYVALFFVSPITIRMLGKQEFGLYSLVTSVIGYLALLSLGLGSAYVRFYFRVKNNKYKYSVENLNGMYFLTFLVISAVVVIFGIGFIIFSNNIFGPKLTAEEHFIAKILLSILVFNLATTFIFSIFWSYLRAVERFVTLEIIHLIKVLLGPMITIPILLFGFGSIGFVTATTAVTTLVEIIVAIYAVKKAEIKFEFNVFDKQLFKEILAYSLFIFGFQLFDQLNNGVDNMILGWTGGTEIVSIYAVGASIAAIVLSLPNGITSVSIPEINRVATEVDRKKKLLQINTLQVRYGRMIFMIIAFIVSGFIILGLPFLDIWAGVGYSEAYLIVILLTVPKMYGYTLAVSSEYIKAENRHKTRLTIYGITILINIGISIPLAIWLGPLGAAIGTAATYSIYIFFMHFYYTKVISLSLNQFWLQIFKITIFYILTITPFYILTFFVNMYNVWIFISIGLSFVLIFLIVNYLLVFNSYEKQLINSIINAIVRKNRTRIDNDRL